MILMAERLELSDTMNGKQSTIPLKE